MIIGVTAATGGIVAIMVTVVIGATVVTEDTVVIGVTPDMMVCPGSQEQQEPALGLAEQQVRPAQRG